MVQDRLPTVPRVGVGIGGGGVCIKVGVSVRACTEDSPANGSSCDGS